MSLKSKPKKPVTHKEPVHEEFSVDGEALFSNPKPDERLPARNVSLGDQFPLGSATKDELKALVSENFGLDSDLDGPPIYAAMESITKALMSRLNNKNSSNDSDQVAVFVVTARAWDTSSDLGAKHHPIIDDGSLQLNGGLWIVPPTMRKGYRLSLGKMNLDKVFTFVQEKGLGELPTFIFNPTASEKELRFYQNGVSQMEDMMRFPFEDMTFSVAALDNVLNSLHDENLITPDSLSGVYGPWKQASKFIPRERAEEFFQTLAKVALSVVFRSPKYTIKPEIRGKEGRCDLGILSSAGGSWSFEATLELKVLKSYTSSGKAVGATAQRNALSDGVVQAKAYMTENLAKNGFLCCYDMRRPEQANGKACFGPILKFALANVIQLRLYPVHGSSKAYRKIKYAME